MLDLIDKDKYSFLPVNPFIPENLPELVEIILATQLAKIMKVFQVEVHYLGRGDSVAPQIPDQKI